MSAALDASRPSAAAAAAASPSRAPPPPPSGASPSTQRRRGSSSSSSAVRGGGGSAGGSGAGRDAYDDALLTLQSDMDEGLLRIMLDYRTLLGRTMEAENACFSSCQYTRSDLARALVLCLDAARDRVRHCLARAAAPGSLPAPLLAAGAAGLSPATAATAATAAQQHSSGSHGSGSSSSLGLGLLKPQAFVIRYEQDLHRACRDGDLAAVRQLVEERHISPNAPTHLGQTPVWLAVEAEAVDVLRYLLAHGASPNLPRLSAGSLEPPLHMAARANSVPMVRLLLRHGARRFEEYKDLSPLTLPDLHLSTWTALMNTPGPDGKAGEAARHSAVETELSEEAPLAQGNNGQREQRKRDVRNAKRREKREQTREAARQEPSDAVGLNGHAPGSSADSVVDSQSKIGQNYSTLSPPKPGENGRAGPGLGTPEQLRFLQRGLPNALDDGQALDGGHTQTAQPRQLALDSGTDAAAAAKRLPGAARPASKDIGRARSGLKAAQTSSDADAARLVRETGGDAAYHLASASAHAAGDRSEFQHSSAVKMEQDSTADGSSLLASTGDKWDDGDEATGVTGARRGQLRKAFLPAGEPKLLAQARITSKITNDTVFLIATQAAEALGLGSKSPWNRHRFVYKYTCDKKERCALATHNGIEEKLFEPHGNLVLRDEMAELAKTHSDYKDKPEHLANLLALPQIRVPPDMLAAMVDRAARMLAEPQQYLAGADVGDALLQIPQGDTFAEPPTEAEAPGALTNDSVMTQPGLHKPPPRQRRKPASRFLDDDEDDPPERKRWSGSRPGQRDGAEPQPKAKRARDVPPKRPQSATGTASMPALQDNLPGRHSAEIVRQYDATSVDSAGVIQGLESLAAAIAAHSSHNDPSSMAQSAGRSRTSTVADGAAGVRSSGVEDQSQRASASTAVGPAVAATSGSADQTASKPPKSQSVSSKSDVPSGLLPTSLSSGSGSGSGGLTKGASEADKAASVTSASAVKSAPVLPALPKAGPTAVSAATVPITTLSAASATESGSGSVETAPARSTSTASKVAGLSSPLAALLAQSGAQTISVTVSLGDSPTPPSKAAPRPRLSSSSELPSTASATSSATTTAASASAKRPKLADPRPTPTASGKSEALSKVSGGKSHGTAQINGGAIMAAATVNTTAPTAGPAPAVLPAMPVQDLGRSSSAMVTALPDSEETQSDEEWSEVAQGQV